MKKVSLMTVLCCLILNISADVFGQTVTDQQNGYWGGLNLLLPNSFGGIPDANTTVSIENGYKVEVGDFVSALGFSYNASADSVNISNGTLIIDHSPNSLTVSRGMSMSGGTLSNVGTITTGTGITISGGTLDNEGTITTGTGITISGGETHTNSGTINGGLTVNGGILTIKDGGNVSQPITLGAGGTIIVEKGGTIDLTDANIDPAGTLIIRDGGNIKGSYDGELTLEQAIKGGQWNFFGFPIKENGAAGIGIEPLANVAGDIWAVRYDYTNNQWDGNYLHWNATTKDYIKVGEGIFAWSDADYTLSVKGRLVNGQDVSITNDITAISGLYRWMALANPYSVRIPIDKAKAGTQGDGVYIWNGTTYTQTSTGNIEPGEGFVVNMLAGNNTYTFNYANLTSTAKTSSPERVFLKVSVSTNGYKVPVSFAKNEAASVEYDIFDANKLFGDGSVAEPYLICNGINLCKEEVNALPYIATMNIKSGEAQSVEIIAENIPEGYSLVLLDGEEEIAMNQGDIHTVNIASGENAERFKLKIGEKNVSITDVENVADLSIRNNNRNIIIEGGKNIRAEVYNTLGQKVYETTARNFNIEGVAAGAYVIKVQSGKAVQSQKVIIR